MNKPTGPEPQPVSIRSGGFRRAGRILAGGLLLIVGAVLLILPRPGLLVIAAP